MCSVVLSARLSDLNPYNVILGNHDWMRAARLAWVRAALDVLDAAKETIDAGYSKFDRSDTLRFEKHARSILLFFASRTLHLNIHKNYFFRASSCLFLYWYQNSRIMKFCDLKLTETKLSSCAVTDKVHFFKLR